MAQRQPRLSSTACLVAGLGLAALAGSFALAQPAGLDGRMIAFDRSKGNCLSCHQIAGGDLPGTIGPPLSDMKTRFPDRKELFSIIYDETKRNPQTVMPPFGRNLVLSEQEINAVIDFLYTL